MTNKPTTAPEQKEIEWLIETSKRRSPMTDEEWHAQRASFIRGELAIGLDAEEAAARAALSLTTEQEEEV